MFGAIPAGLLIEIGRSQGVYIQQELDLGCPEHFFLKPEYMTSLSKGFTRYTSGGSRYGVISSVDHPAFAELRDYLEKHGYIKTERSYSNGDRVLKPFFLNNFLLVEGDKFLSSGACGCKKELTENYNEGEIIEGLKNYRDSDEYFW